MIDRDGKEKQKLFGVRKYNCVSSETTRNRPSAHDQRRQPDSLMIQSYSELREEQHTNCLTGPDRTGPDRTGPDRTGPDRTGRDGTGPDRTGPDRSSRPSDPANNYYW